MVALFIREFKPVVLKGEYCINCGVYNYQFLVAKFNYDNTLFACSFIVKSQEDKAMKFSKVFFSDIKIKNMISEINGIQIQNLYIIIDIR